ncbi:hypothetical protein DTL42_23690 [Bremerella cremea]|uniref:Uncharacterized protein n=1 Tax=Bremerella cremea TaxID=1031537 RepID=A0A368KKV5_9BACT|nr:hypothetical protein [Bremerella cremea]RCS40388.1 hypothetical protein DTL42_23690 [Bremerella cremea]
MPANTNNHQTPNSFLASSQFTAILVGLFLLELVVISSFTYFKVRAELQPTQLVDQAEKALQENYPRIRQRVTEEVKKQAPQIAETISNELIQSTPEARRWLEETTRRQLDYTLDETTQLSTEEFRELLQAHHKEIETLFQEIEAAPNETKEVVLDFESSIDKSWGIDLQNQARNALELHRRLNDKLERLTSDAPLDPKELLERRIVRILRTMEEERLPQLPTLSQTNS